MNNDNFFRGVLINENVQFDQLKNDKGFVSIQKIINFFPEQLNVFSKKQSDKFFDTLNLLPVIKNTFKLAVYNNDGNRICMFYNDEYNNKYTIDNIYQNLIDTMSDLNNFMFPSEFIEQDNVQFWWSPIDEILMFKGNAKVVSRFNDFITQ